MNNKFSSLSLCCVGILATTATYAVQPPTFDTAWITGRPEVLTYRSTATQGDGLYQVSVSRTGTGIDLYMNIITPGFTKSVWGAMTTNMQPRESKARIVVRDQVIMTTDCSYNSDQLHIATLIAPYNRLMEKTLSCSNLVVDFSQIPILARTLPLKPGAEFEFSSLNPQNNSLVPLRIHVVGDETIRNIPCHKVAGTDFEGEAFYWIEKAGHHRVIRIEQPATGRVTQLLDP